MKWKGRSIRAHLDFISPFLLLLLLLLCDTSNLIKSRKHKIRYNPLAMSRPPVSASRAEVSQRRYRLCRACRLARVRRAVRLRAPRVPGELPCFSGVTVPRHGGRAPAQSHLAAQRVQVTSAPVHFSVVKWQVLAGQSGTACGSAVARGFVAEPELAAVPWRWEGELRAAAGRDQVLKACFTAGSGHPSYVELLWRFSVSL